MSNDEKQAAKTAAEEAREAALKAIQTEVDGLNTPLTGKGLRWAAGMTRGKNPNAIKWQHFDEEKPETLPESLEEFATLSGVADAKKFLVFVISGYNDEQYRLASDELNEFIEPHWNQETVTQFRFAVRNAVKLSKKPLETVVIAIKSMME
jgi:hypothetical protein